VSAGTPWREPSEEVQRFLTVLDEVLTTERDLYLSMLALSTREEVAIVGDDVAQLTDVVNEKEDLLEHLSTLETERMTAIVAISAATGLDPETATLTDISEAVPAMDGLRLMESGMALRTQAVALEQANRRNQRLLEASRGLVDRWIQYLKTVLSNSVYTPDGQLDDSRDVGSLDRSA
jgi:flagellar biosynthesis/type III secretory pathway chaperone